LKLPESADQQIAEHAAISERQIIFYNTATMGKQNQNL
jgi:hypothetical protein